MDALTTTGELAAVKNLKIAILSGNSANMLVAVDLTVGGALEMLRSDEDLRRRLGNPNLAQFDVMIDSSQINTTDQGQLGAVLPDGAIIFLSENVEGA